MSDDGTWDGVWEAKTAILDNGWSLEMKIPYHVIRLSPKERYVWGINAYRHIARKSEWTQWSFTPSGMSGWTSKGRASYSFTPQLSLQLFVQPFVTTGDYGLIKELVGEKSYSFAPFDGLEENPDFENRAMRSNLVLRWEYRPGSTLFLVWQQSRDRDLEEIDDPEFEPLSGTDDGDSIFLVKFNRWFGL